MLKEKIYDLLSAPEVEGLCLDSEEDRAKLADYLHKEVGDWFLQKTQRLLLKHRAGGL